MANEEQLSILKQGVEVWNEWRGQMTEQELRTRSNRRTDEWELIFSGYVNLGKQDFMK